MKKSFSPHRKRGSKKLGGPSEEPQGKGQWSKQKPFFTDSESRVRKINYPSKDYMGETITFKVDNKGVITAHVEDRTVGRALSYDEALRQARQHLRNDYDLEHNITKTERKFKSKAIPLKELQNRRDLKWKEIQKAEKEATERGVTDPEELFQIRLNIVKKWENRLKQPDLKPIIYQVSHGHYGGYYVEVPEEHFEEFKSYFLPREFPRRVETFDVTKKWNEFGVKRFHQKYPNSNKIKQVFFANRSVGTQRLDFLELPIPER